MLQPCSMEYSFLVRPGISSGKANQSLENIHFLSCNRWPRIFSCGKTTARMNGASARWVKFRLKDTKAIISVSHYLVWCHGMKRGGQSAVRVDNVNSASKKTSSARKHFGNNLLDNICIFTATKNTYRRQKYFLRFQHWFCDSRTTFVSSHIAQHAPANRQQFRPSMFLTCRTSCEHNVSCAQYSISHKVQYSFTPMRYLTTSLLMFQD